jgi:small subunit ribosomal protein S12e
MPPGAAVEATDLCRAIEKDQAQMAILADDCNQPDYLKLVTSLCNEKSIPMVRSDFD